MRFRDPKKKQEAHQLSAAERILDERDQLLISFKREMQINCNGCEASAQRSQIKEYIAG